jgi:hypothetical protein
MPHEQKLSPHDPTAPPDSTRATAPRSQAQPRSAARLLIQQLLLPMTAAMLCLGFFWVLATVKAIP